MLSRIAKTVFLVLSLLIEPSLLSADTCTVCTHCLKVAGPDYTCEIPFVITCAAGDYCDYGTPPGNGANCGNQSGTCTPLR